MPARRLAEPTRPTHPRHSSSPEPATIESPMKMSRMSIWAARMARMPTEPPLPTGFTLRAAAPGDEATVAAIGIAQDLHDLGEADYSEDEVQAEWSAPGFDPTRDAWLVFAGDGTPAAFASVEGTAGRVFMDPSFKGRGLGSHLAARIEAHARELGARKVMQQVFGPADAARELLAARGYENDQHFWRMRIDLDGGAAIPASRWPDGLAAGSYERERDEHDVHRLIQSAFADSPGMVQQTLAEWRASWGRPARIDPGLTPVVVTPSGDLAGVATCAVQDEGGAYLAQLAVDAATRGR